MKKPVSIAIGALWALFSSSIGALPAHADRVHLVDGAVIEGKATRKGDKVVVELESGELALPADQVQRIESSVSDVQRADVMYGKLGARDVDGLIEFANFCRDHGMFGREQMALQRVIELAPENAQARARLGYVRADGTWIKREDQLRARGMVQYEGRWITRAEMLQLERLRAETETAKHARDKAEAEAKKAEFETEQARARGGQAQAQPASAPVASPTVAPYVTYSWPSAYAAPYSGCVRMRRGVCIDDEPPRLPARSAHAAFPIAGVKDPFDYFR